MPAIAPCPLREGEIHSMRQTELLKVCIGFDLPASFRPTLPKAVFVHHKTQRVPTAQPIVLGIKRFPRLAPANDPTASTDPTAAIYSIQAVVSPTSFHNNSKVRQPHLENKPRRRNEVKHGETRSKLMAKYETDYEHDQNIRASHLGPPPSGDALARSHLPRSTAFRHALGQTF